MVISQGKELKEMGADFGWEYPAGVTSKDIDDYYSEDQAREDDAIREEDSMREEGGEYAR